MSRKEIRNQVYLENGARIFVDSKNYNETVIIASYGLITKMIPTNQLKANCASIFGLQTAQISLSPLYQKILSCLYYMDLSYAETARRVKVSTSQVSRLENKAIWQLRKFSKEFLT